MLGKILNVYNYFKSCLRSDQDLTEIDRIFSYLKQSGSANTVHLTDGNCRYSAKVSATSLVHGAFVLEDFWPHLPNGLFEKGRVVEILANSNTGSLIFNSKFEGPLVPDDDFGYQFRIPLYSKEALYRPSYQLSL